MALEVLALARGKDSGQNETHQCHLPSVHFLDAFLSMERGDIGKQFENWVTMALTPGGRGELFEQLGFYYVVGSAMQNYHIFQRKSETTYSEIVVTL